MNPQIRSPHLRGLRERAAGAPISGIVEVFDYARGRDDLIPLWVGESDLPTPEFIARPAAEALLNGETFYTWQQGIPELRMALGRYYARHFGIEAGPQDFCVTGSGMQAVQLAVQAVMGEGDECIYLSPAWPNITVAMEIGGATAVSVGLDFSEDGWLLDPEKLEAAVTPRTRAIFINTPSNPTGWAADIAGLRAVLDIARRRGLWIIADEIYALLWYGEGNRAPSFLDVAAADDRILYVNTFSKNWAMTGWRIGWIKAHPELMSMFENLVQHSTSGVPQFLQRGATAALDQGDGFVDSQRERTSAALSILCEAFSGIERARFARPQGAFYLFFAVDGITDTTAAAKRIIDETGVVLAPGSAFGAEGEGFFRLCFNRDLAQIREAAKRMAGWLS
jgi:aspartate/methionine/tyrosine aminotransferase